jgi:hypothetical protein
VRAPVLTPVLRDFVDARRDFPLLPDAVGILALFIVSVDLVVVLAAPAAVGEVVEVDAEVEDVGAARVSAIGRDVISS